MEKKKKEIKSFFKFLPLEMNFKTQQYNEVIWCKF